MGLGRAVVGGAARVRGGDVQGVPRAARYAHEAVTQILGSIEREWTNLTSALEAGQVPLEVPSDMIELGTDADPTRRVPLTKATG